jgi:hypothetical protein
MIVCANCQHQEMSGALFCSRCGAALVAAQGVTHVTPPAAGSYQEIPTAPVIPPFPADAEEAEIALFLVDQRKYIPLPNSEEISLGRVNSDQPIIPDIDLTPFNAYESGVSRLHVSIRIKEDEVSVVDLASANGTRLNGKRIDPHIPNPLAHGDILTLGKLKVQILFRK